VEDDSVEGLGAVDWALALAAKLHESRENAAGQPQVYRLNLTKPQRKALERTTLRKAIKNRLAAGEQALNLGLVEVMEIAFAISRAVKSASGREKRTLVNVASKVAEGLNSLLKMSHGGR
jgi:hypothetical protein